MGGKAKIEARVYAYKTTGGVVDMVDFYHSTSPGGNPNWLYIGSKKPSSGGFVDVESIPFVLSPAATQAVRVNIRWLGSELNPQSCSSGEYDDVDDLVFVVDTSSASTTSVVSVAVPVNMPMSLPEPQIRCAGYGSVRCAAANSCKWDGKDCLPMN